MESLGKRNGLPDDAGVGSGSHVAIAGAAEVPSAVANWGQIVNR